MKRNDLEFLSEASKILASSLDYHVTLASIANLVVTNMADFCIIDLLSDVGTMERVAVRVKNPKYKALAQKMYTFAPDPANKDAIYDTARKEKPVLIKKATIKWLDSVSQIPQERKVIRELGLNSHIFAPLISRGIVIGVLTMASQNPTFSYKHSDLLLAEELASRAGIAVDKARLYSEAQNALRLRDEFLSIASHELKTPLTSILLHVQSSLSKVRKHSKEKGTQEKIEQMLETAEQQTKRLGKLISDLLNVSVVSTGRLGLEKEKVRLSDIVLDVLDRLKLHIQEQKYKIDLQMDEKVKGMWDRVRIEQVVSNLLTNALKYGEGKPIHITVAKKGAHAILKVTDEGIGIPKDKQKEIFDRFKRAVSTKDYAGLGLGLYIAKQIVHAHGGRITLEKSARKKGSTFVVSLPLD